MEHVDALENYLREAPILDAYVFPVGGAHPDKKLLVLDGGVSVLAKPGPTPEAVQMARREVAAWRIARALGWSDLMGATVLRALSEVEGAGAEASIQVIWPPADPDPPAETFSEEEITRAATFDAIIQHTDRSGHNWLGVPKAEAGSACRLKLVDHGYALDYPGQPPNVQSTFFELRKTQALPDGVIDAVKALIADWPPVEVNDLVGEEAAANVKERAKRIAEDGVLMPNEE